MEEGAISTGELSLPLHPQCRPSTTPHIVPAIILMFLCAFPSIRLPGCHAAAAVLKASVMAFNPSPGTPLHRASQLLR